MDDLITLSEAASSLSPKSEFDLLYLAINQTINLFWERGDIEGLTITPLAISKTSDLTDEPTMVYKTDKTKQRLEHQHGPWLLDPQIDDRWPYIFQVLKDKVSFDFVLQPGDPPLRFIQDGVIYAAYTTNPYEFNTPRLSELYIDSREIGEIKKMLRGDYETPIPRDLGKQRLKVIEEYIKENPPANETPARGKRGYKDEVWQAIKEEKAKDGSLLFAKKPTNSPDKRFFSPAWKKRKSRDN